MSRLCRLKTKTHGDDGKWAHQEITRLRAELASAVKDKESAQESFGTTWSLEQRCQKRIVELTRQRDELLAAAEAIEINAEECLDWDDSTAMLVPIDDYHKLIEAIDTVKGGA